MGGVESLSDMELLILRSIPKAKDVMGLSKLTKVAPSTLGIEIAKLQMRGYIADDGTLSEKGTEAVRQATSG
jgi:hypothetical protein